MKNRNKWLVTAIVVVALIIILAVVWVLRKEGPSASQQQAQSNTQVPPTQNATVPDATDPTTTEPGATDAPQNTDPNETEKPDNGIPFPYAISGCTLVIEQVNSYDGIFFEDGSDKEVTNVTAIVLTNTGEACVEYVDITLDRDDTTLRFTASSIDAGATVIVIEADCKSFAEGTYSNCTADVATVNELEMSQDQVSVEEVADGALLVTNLTDTNIPCIRIFYKFYMDDVNVYVGGITYTAKVVDLAAGDTCLITPSHYLKGYSKIVMIKTYDTAD